MTVRVLFTVALVAAVAAVALPAVETASVDRAESDVRGAVDRLVDAARTLAASNDALASGDAAARQAIAVDLPGAGFASAGLDVLTLGPAERGTDRDSGAGDGGPDPAATRVTWRVEGGERHVAQVDGLRVRSPDGGQFRLDRGGRRRLVLRLVERDAGRVVLLSGATGRRNSGATKG